MDKRFLKYTDEAINAYLEKMKIMYQIARKYLDNPEKYNNVKRGRPRKNPEPGMA